MGCFQCYFRLEQGAVYKNTICEIRAANVYSPKFDIFKSHILELELAQICSRKDNISHGRQSHQRMLRALAKNAGKHRAKNESRILTHQLWPLSVDAGCSARPFKILPCREVPVVRTSANQAPCAESRYIVRKDCPTQR